MSLADNVKRFRNALDLSQEALADRVGTGKNYISMIERGHRKPSHDVLEALARSLGVSTADLVGNESQRPAPIPIRGKVFAGPAGNYIDDYEPGAHPVLEPFESEDRIAVIVDGDSMLPRFRQNETLIFGPMRQDPVGMVGMEVMAALPDGRRMVKVLRPGRNAGSWDLYSINTSYQVIENVKLLWARRFEGLKV